MCQDEGVGMWVGGWGDGEAANLTVKIIKKENANYFVNFHQIPA
jgi:hypothetical protein